MDETWLREELERATASEPPMGPVAINSLRAGIRRRRRRRVQGIAATAAMAALFCAAGLAVAGAVGQPTATPAHNPATVYVLGGSWARTTVTPISTVTNTPGTPIVAGSSINVPAGPMMAITPDGKTIWVANVTDTVTPISTATNTAGKPVTVGRYHDATLQVVISPDGKTVYVLDAGDTVTPISTATDTPGKPISLGAGGGEMAITPDGKTLYVLMFSVPGMLPSRLYPIATATDTPGRGISLATDATSIVIPPHGKTAYVVGMSPASHLPSVREIEVTPIDTAANTPGKPIRTGATGNINFQTPVVMTQDGQAIYIADDAPNGVIPFSTVTNTPGKMIRIDAASTSGILGLAIAPDGRTAYVASQVPSNAAHPSSPGRDTLGLKCPRVPVVATPTTGFVTPIATATGAVGKPINVGCSPTAIAVAPDGQTVYVGTSSGAVTPIATATNQPGEPVKTVNPVAILILPRPR